MGVVGHLCSPHTIKQLKNNTIKLREIQLRIIDDHVHFEGIDSVSLSTVDRVLKCNRLRMKQLY